MGRSSHVARELQSIAPTHESQTVELKGNRASCATLHAFERAVCSTIKIIYLRVISLQMAQLSNETSYIGKKLYIALY